jgi:hypothetical protein
VAEQQKRSLKARAVVEAKKFLILFLYLWALLFVFEVHRSLILRNHVAGGEQTFRFGFAFLKALVLAKFMLLAESTGLAERFKEKPLIYPILFKSAVYSVILVGLDILEEIIIGLLHGRTIAQSMPELVSGGGLEAVLLLGIMGFVVLLPLFAFKEVGDALGAGELRTLLFKGRSKAEANCEKLAA